jgi:hypothetical protein
LALYLEIFGVHGSKVQKNLTSPLYYSPHRIKKERKRKSTHNKKTLTHKCVGSDGTLVNSIKCLRNYLQIYFLHKM